VWVRTGGKKTRIDRVSEKEGGKDEDPQLQKEKDTLKQKNNREGREIGKPGESCRSSVRGKERVLKKRKTRGGVYVAQTLKSTKHKKLTPALIVR